MGALCPASKDWGTLGELEAEDRLARACEKAPLSDVVLEELRKAYVAMVAEYKVETDKEKAEVCLVTSSRYGSVNLIYRSCVT